MIKINRGVLERGKYRALPRGNAIDILSIENYNDTKNAEIKTASSG